MLLGEACKVYILASLSLDDILDQVPPPNQLCLITAIMLLSQKSNSEPKYLINQEEPWDPVTLLQRWILRSRVAGTEDSGLDLGESKHHADALEIKLAALDTVPTDSKVLCIQCQISSELGQYYCWSGQYGQAIKYLDQCQGVHGLCSNTSESHLKCFLNLHRTAALLKMARLATGVALQDPKEDLLNQIKRMDQSHRHQDLVLEFKKDNRIRNLPYSWRQRLMQNVLNRMDFQNGTFLAVANALYHLQDPCDMILEIPSQVLIHLRSVTFSSGNEVNAYLTPSIFEDVMALIAEIQTSYTDTSIRIPGISKDYKTTISLFVLKLTSTIGHVLCYEAAWRSAHFAGTISMAAGLLEPSSDEWRSVWDMYSVVLLRSAPASGNLANQLPPASDATESLGKSWVLEHMDPDDLEEYLRIKNLPPLTSCLVSLAMSAHSCNHAHYTRSVRLLQSTTQFLSEDKQQHHHRQQEQHLPYGVDGEDMVVASDQIEFHIDKYSTWSQLGILAEELEQGRDARIASRVEQRVRAKAEAVKNDRRTPRVATTLDRHLAPIDGEAMIVEDVRGTNSSDTGDFEMAMDLGQEDDSAFKTAANEEVQERVKKEEQARLDEEKTIEISRLLDVYLKHHGALELNLQLRCLALCINAKLWEFLSIYGRSGVEQLNKSIHGEICQVYSVLVPLCEILNRSQALGVDFKDIASVSCLDALISSDLQPITVTRLAAFDMIQGLMPNVARPHSSNLHAGALNSNISNSNTNNNRIGSSSNNANQHHIHPQKARRSFQEDGALLGHGAAMDEDLGHAVILKLFALVRLRGVVDVFGALLAGAISSILPERAKLTLSEFGYHALFTTSMDSVSSWSDPRVKIIAMVSNGESGQAIEVVPGARQRFAKLLIQIYERQVQYESDTLTKKLKTEAKTLALAEKSQAVDHLEMVLGLKMGEVTHNCLFTTKAWVQITRYSLCLTDLYHLEGMHQDALASFLNACMVASKCFADVERLDRRVWAAYAHGPIVSATSPLQPQHLSGQQPSGAGMTQSVIIPSQTGFVSGVPSVFGTPPPPSHTAGLGDPHIMPTYPTLTALSAMNNTAGNNVGIQGQVGLGLIPSPTSSLDASGPTALGPYPPSPPLPPPPPPPHPPGALSGGPPSSTIAAASSPVGSPPPAVPSTFAVRAIDSCMLLNEPLASVVMQQFLPRMDYSQAFATIRVAYDQGLLNFSGKASSTALPVTTIASAAATASTTLASATVPGGGNISALPTVNSGGVGSAGAGGAGAAMHLLSGNGSVAVALTVPGSSPSVSGVLASPRVQSSASIFTPEATLTLTGSTAGRRGSALPQGVGVSGGSANIAGGSSTQRRTENSMPRQLFLDLVFDLSMLELVSFLCKEAKDLPGLLAVQARINSNRMALDARPQLSGQVHSMAQQDLLTWLWSRYARIG
ncbi:hypothetical protein BGZ99_005986 [Dissophora globulifera]|uniref:Uncharacterized protein n=1 Tax=Dissophora globulifera TaxID=979702 RepID=A0A9P6RV05_9FUNG|nr:hypothetical protein BGZ99_005986 [Dissophora globulifera]